MTLLTADTRIILNPRHVQRIAIDDREKPHSATGQRQYKVLAYMDASALSDDDSRCYALTQWLDDEIAARDKFSEAGRAITRVQVQS